MIEFSKTRAPKSELLCRVEPSGIKHKSLSYEDIRITRYSLVVMPDSQQYHSNICLIKYELDINIIDFESSLCSTVGLRI